MHVGRNFGSNSLDGTIPAALSALNKLSFLCARSSRDAALVRLRASACPLVSVSTPACARTHRRTAVRVPSPHVAGSTLAAAPAVAQRRGVLGMVWSTPSRARALCVPVASAAHVAFHCPAQIMPRTRP